MDLLLASSLTSEDLAQCIVGFSACCTLSAQFTVDSKGEEK